MHSLTSTIAATAALAGLPFTLAAPSAPKVAARQLPSSAFQISANSIYTPAVYTETLLSGTHIGAGEEAFGPAGSNPAGYFGLNSTTHNLFYYQSVNGGSAKREQPLTFVGNSTYPALEYGFFGLGSLYYEYEIDETTGAIGRVVDSGEGEPVTTFYLCPEYVVEGEPGSTTVSVLDDFDAVPSSAGCNAVTLTKVLI